MAINKQLDALNSLKIPCIAKMEYLRLLIRVTLIALVCLH